MSEVKFPRDFEGDGESPIHVGRIYVGDHVVRLIFCPDGKVRAIVPDAAVKDGSVIVSPPIPEGTLLGLSTNG